MTNQLEALLHYCCDKGRVCPQPQKWLQFWDLLPNRRRQGNAWEPPPPLILAAWWDTSSGLKSSRLREHIEWAYKHGALDSIERFLRELPEEGWFHEND